MEKMVYVVLHFLLGLVGRELSDDTFVSFMQFIKFGIVGISNTVVSYLIYVISLVIFKKLGIFVEFDYLMSQVIAFILSVLWSFYWNNKMVFTIQEGQKRSIWKTLLKTYVSYSFTGLFLNSILIILWVHVFGISEFLAPIINLVISVPINFLINKFWAFKT